MSPFHSPIMQSPTFIFYFTLSTLFIFLNLSNARTITVDQSGKGDFTQVQQAIDSIPSNNNEWTVIHLRAGVYNEKVVIPKDKPYIILEGESRRASVIQYGDSGSSLDSTTFKLYAGNFLARDITFKNTYKHGIVEQQEGITWAPAFYIQGDKVSFYRCGFIGIQDTLTDWQGRHYFESCYIEGAIDFIWGGGQSIYQRCDIHVTAASIGVNNAYITAQARDSETDTSGFVFKYCSITGTGPALLGRAYRSHSRVLFFKSKFDNIIAPEGWYAWNAVGKEEGLTFAEAECFGPGSDRSNRVKWEKNLQLEEVTKLVSKDLFINQDNWIEEQLKHQ